MTISQQKRVDMIQTGLNLISQAISIYDHELKLVHANRRMQTMFQVPADLLQPGVDFGDLLRYVAERGEYGQLDDIGAFVDEKVKLALAFEPHYFERTRANGTSISVEGCPLESGGWITVFTDITAIKRDEEIILSKADGLSQELLQRSEELTQTNRQLAASVRSLETTQQELIKSRGRLELINRMTPAHIAHVNSDGTYTHSNGRLPSVIPFTESNIVGRKFEQVLGSEVCKEVMPSFEKALNGEASVSEFREENSGRFIRLAMTPDIDKNDRVRGAYILSTDATEEVQARRALAHANRKALATQLTSVMAHDFSNLLTIIMGQQNQLEKIVGDDQTLNNISKTIQSATRRGAELIDTLNRIETQRHIDAVKVNASDFVSSISRLAKAAIAKGIDLKFDIDIPDKNLMIDPGFANDAILNLVINAAEACGKSGMIAVQIVVTRQQELQFRVQDDGPGFSDDGLGNAFKPFYSTKDDKVGRGLGLSSAFDFARSCGGSLRIRNLEDGGALVVMTIPYLPVRSSEGEMILVVDDDDEVRAVISDHLRSGGRMVVEASSLLEARELVKLEGLSSVITDLDLGNANTGLDVAAIVPEDVAVLVVTGLNASDPRRQQAQVSYPVLEKPFELNALDLAMSRISL